MIRTDGLVAFVAIVESGSMSEAARRLRLAKSVVSEHLIELERTLGGALLRRSTRRLSLTEDGAAFLERARRILSEMDGAASDMAERRGLRDRPAHDQRARDLRPAASRRLSTRSWRNTLTSA